MDGTRMADASCPDQPTEHELEVFAPRPRTIEQPLANGRDAVGGRRSGRHASASMYGRITRVTRQILA